MSEVRQQVHHKMSSRSRSVFAHGTSKEALAFWFDALIQGVIALKEGKLTVDLTDVDLKDASVAPNLIQALLNWKSSTFADATKRLLTTTLTATTIELPGGASFTLAPRSLETRAGALSLRSAISIMK